MPLFAKKISNFAVLIEDLCYLGTYNGTSWYLIINVTSKFLYTRCNLAYLSWCPWVTFIWFAIWLAEDYANSLKQHEGCYFEEHRSNPTSDMKSRSLNRKHLLFLFETCCWHVAANHVTIYYNVRYCKYIMLKLPMLSLRLSLSFSCKTSEE